MYGIELRSPGAADSDAPCFHARRKVLDEIIAAIVPNLANDFFRPEEIPRKTCEFRERSNHLRFAETSTTSSSGRITNTSLGTNHSRLSSASHDSALGRQLPEAVGAYSVNTNRQNFT